MIETILGIITSVTITLLSTIVVGLYKDNKRIRNERKTSNLKEERASQKGMRALLRESLIQLHDEVIKQGYITCRQRERWEELFIAYHELGGNGMITDMNEEIRDLTIR